MVAAAAFLKFLYALYLRKVASLCEQYGPLSTCLCPKYITFRFQKLGNSREDKNGRR